MLLGHRIDLGAGQTPGGNWAEWRWDGASLALSNDRYRGYPVYYASSDSFFAVSPSVDVLLDLGVDRELDTDAIAAFLTVGFYPGEDTAFKAIKAMPPAAKMSWRQGHLDIVSATPRRPDVGVSRAEAVGALAELTRAAVRRSIPDDPEYLMPLSGGRDSRHILLELLDAGHRPARCLTAYHHANVWGGDPPYAARLCEVYDLEHTILEAGPLIPDEWRKNRVTSYAADEHAWYGSVAAALNGHTSHTYDGLNGSTAFAREYFTPKMQRLDRERRWDDLAANMGRRVKGQPRYAPLLAPGARSRLGADAASARIRRELDRHAGGPEPYLALRFWGRTVRELNLTSTAFLPDVPAAYTPFMDPELVEFAWTVPTEHVDEHFHDDVIGVYYPEANDIPYRPRFEPTPSRTFLRQMNRHLLQILRRHSDGSLVDRGTLLRRAAFGAVTGDSWFAWARRAALLTYLVQLESIARGDGPGDFG